MAQIFISYDTEMTSFQYQYIEDGTSKLSPMDGRTRGPYFEVVTFEPEREHITKISGTHNGASAQAEICSLSFETNLPSYGPFGAIPEFPSKFKFEFGPRSPFGGFFGALSRRNFQLTSIGAYMMPK